MTMASGLFGPTLRDQFDASALGVNLVGAGHTQALVTDTYTPDFNAHDHFADVTNEVSGSGYTAGGAAFSSPTLAVAGGVLTFDAADESWTSATISSIRGRVAYDDSVTNDPLTVATTFGADYSVTSGTFTITENASGIFTIDFTP